MKIERTKNAIRSICWGMGSKVISILLPFLFRTVMLKCLGADYLGLNSLMVSILQVLNLAELGFGSAVVYSMYEPIANDDAERINALLKYYRKIYLSIGLIVFILGMIVLPFLPYFINGDYPTDINLRVVFFLYLINTAFSYIYYGYKGAIIAAFQRNDLESKANMIVSVIKYTGEILLIYFTRNYYVVLLIELFATLLNNTIKSIYVNSLFPIYKCEGDLLEKEKKKIKSNVSSLMLHKIGGIILNSTDTIVISMFMGVVMVSRYTNYFYIVNAVEGILVMCFASMTAGIGNSIVTEEKSKNIDYFKKILFFNAWIVGWCSVCFTCLFQDFMQIWTGKEHMFEMRLVLLIVIYFYVHGIRRTIITFRDAAGMWRDNRWQPIVSASFNLVVNCILINIIGIYGVVISSIISMVLIDMPWETKKICKTLNIDVFLYYKSLFKYAVVTIFVVTVSYLISTLFHFSVGLNLIIKLVVVCVGMANVLLWIIFRRKSEYTYFCGLVKKYLNR